MNSISKLFGIGHQKFMGMLRDHKILMKNNIPYQEYMKYFEVIIKPIKMGKEIVNKEVTLIKPDGINFIMKKLNLKKVVD